MHLMHQRNVRTREVKRKVEVNVDVQNALAGQLYGRRELCPVAFADNKLESCGGH
jgi:hypothetical protein